MDNINSTNIQSLSICDLNTKFNDRCYVDWSKSDLISFISSEGIYILKPQLDLQHGPFQIELIRNPTSRFRHQTLSNIVPAFDNIWQILDTRQYMEIFLDPALMTNVEKLSLDLYPRRFRLAKWSPVIERFPRQCLLAAITIDYQLLIFARKSNTWIVQADLSCDYDKLCTQLNLTKDLKKEEQTFEAIRKNLHSLSFCNICWKETKHNGPILLATTIPGDIVVWQVVPPVKDTEAQNNEQQQFDVKIILRTNLDYISSMNLFENLLIVAARDGQVVLYDLTINFNEFEATSIPSAQQMNGLTAVKTLNLITIPPTATLWHRDNIEVTDFYIQPITQDTFRIVLAKSTNICWCIINYTKKTENEPATLAISDSFSAIDGLDPDVSLHQTPATWLKPAGGKKSVLIADDGSFFQLEFVDDRQDTSPEFNAIRTGRVDLTRMVPRGLCTSPKGHLITMISCISLMYEPAKILAPTKLLLLPTVNDKRFFVDCVQKLLDENWLESKHIESPMDVCDRIDYLRSIYPLLTYENFIELYKTLKKGISEVGLPKSDTQFVKLKIIAFLLMKLLENSNSKMIESDLKVNLDKTVYDVILLYNIENILSITLTELTKDSDALSFTQINSLRNYFNWLDKYPEQKHIREQYIDKFKVLESKYENISFESCSICQAEIPFVSLKYGICGNGHRFDRCARSLLIMNLQTGKELVCDHCKRHYMSDMVWPSRNIWLCSYCQ